MKIIGDLPAGEPLFLLFAVVVFLIRGIGPWFSPTLFWTTLVTGMLMILGYVISDLVAVSGPAQYLRGWARTAMLVMDCVAIQIVLSHGYRYLYWFVLGMAIGVLIQNLVAWIPVTASSWKSHGYGIALGFLVALGCGAFSRWLASATLTGFGLLSVLLDYRSLGGIFVFAGMVMLFRALVRDRARFPVLRSAAIAVVLGAMALAMYSVLTGTENEYLDRRLESNIGRYLGLVVATEAIIDSPLIGYGSWAADRKYTQMLRQEAVRASGRTKHYLDFGESMLPHSQVLQAWIEGGLLAATFFLAYAVALGWAFQLLVRKHRTNPATPLLLVILILGVWNWLASPFLGEHRVYIMLAIGAVSLLIAERRYLSATMRPA